MFKHIQDQPPLAFFWAVLWLLLCLFNVVWSRRAFSTAGMSTDTVALSQNGEFCEPTPTWGSLLLIPHQCHGLYSIYAELLLILNIYPMSKNLVLGCSHHVHKEYPDVRKVFEICTGVKISHELDMFSLIHNMYVIEFYLKAVEKEQPSYSKRRSDDKLQVL